MFVVQYWADQSSTSIDQIFFFRFNLLAIAIKLQDIYLIFLLPFPRGETEVPKQKKANALLRTGFWSYFSKVNINIINQI